VSRADRINTILERSGAGGRADIQALLNQLCDRELMDLDLSNELLPLRSPALAEALPPDRLRRLVFRGRPDFLKRLMDYEAVYKNPTQGNGETIWNTPQT
jgi:hypothetical protein